MDQTVAILMATYNGEKYIRQQIDSILNQTYKSWKLYVSDDVSDDNTMNILKFYQRNYPEKIIVLEKEERLGAKENFLFLMRNVEGYSYYMFSDQDDIWIENKIECQLECMKRLENQNGSNKALMVFSDMSVVDSDLRIIDDSFLRFSGLEWIDDNIMFRYCIHNFTAGCSMMFNEELMHNGRNIPNDMSMHDYWIALVASCIGKIGYINKPLSLYRQHGNNVIGAKSGKWNIFRLRHSFDAENIRKLRCEKAEKLYAAKMLLERYGEVMPEVDKDNLKLFLKDIEKGDLFHIIRIMKKFHIRLGVNYIYMLMLKV